jgi:murein DD-endopeptidase MepM/ murein hydrolase activator NlpD
MRFWWCLLLLLGPVTAAAQELTLVPATIASGGVSRLRFVGETPFAASARCNGKVINLTPDATGATALIGVDLDTLPGVYSVAVTLSDRSGRATQLETVLQVTAADRPVERLTLPEAMVSPDDPETLRRIARERTLVDQVLAGRSPAAEIPVFAPPVSDPVGSTFGRRRVLNGQARAPHAGVDFRSPRGRPVRASAPGRVVFAGELYYTGKIVIIDHGDGLFSQYAHLQERHCQVGQELDRGAVIGTVGSSGRATGPHLHWALRLRGDRIDPLEVLALTGKSLDSLHPRGNNEGPARKDP